MDADGYNPGRPADGQAIPPDDRTLRVQPDAPALERVFPNPSEDQFFVIYQTKQGDLEMRWCLDAVALAQARDVFGDGLEAPFPLLRLRQLDNGGVSQVIGETPLGTERMAAVGYARCGLDTANGLVQAEIGWSTAAAGWLLLARSNTLLATTPVRASCQREERPSSTVPSVAVVQESARSGQRRPVLPQQAAFFSAAEPLGLQPTATRDAESNPSGFGDAFAVSGQGTDLQTSANGTPGWFLGQGVSDGSGGHVEPPANGSAGTLGAGVEPNQCVRAQGEDRANEKILGKEPVPRPANGVRRQARPEASDGGGLRVVMSGSGPRHDFRVQSGQIVLAELLVHGSASPGTLLDLGGHPYRVGAGGRFSFRVPLADRDLIMRLLATLPELPMPSRETDDEPGETLG